MLPRFQAPGTCYDFPRRFPVAFTFPRLLVSSPNGGGLFLLQDDVALHLDDLNTTGLGLLRNSIVRGIQPAGITIYSPRRRDLPTHGGLTHDIHDVTVIDGFIYAVGTTKNVILKLSREGRLINHWRLPGEDDCVHLNCLAVWRGRIVYSCYGRFLRHREYKDQPRDQGLVCDLETHEALITGLSYPHSPTPDGTSLLVANSHEHELCEYDERGQLLRRLALNGFTRGICVLDGVTYVGVSRERDAGSLTDRAFVVALDRTTWRELGRVEIPAREIYSIIPVEPPLAEALTEIRTGALETATAKVRWAFKG